MIICSLDSRRVVALPVVFLGEHDGARRVVRLDTLALALPAIPAGDIDRARPGIDQLDARIEAPAVAMRVVRTLQAPGVMGARRQILDHQVPGEEGVIGARIEPDGLEGLGTGRRLVEQQLGSSGVPTVDGEVDARILDGRAGRIASSRQYRIGSV
jgi:hypothetical protein